MTSSTLEWYLRSGTGKERLTDGIVQEKLREIEVRRDDLYRTINSRDSHFIDRYFPEFRVSEKKNDPNRWADLQSLTLKYLDFVAWKLGASPDNYEEFELKKRRLSAATKESRKYRCQQELIPPLYQRWQDSINTFVGHNIGLVVTIAKKYCHSKLPIEDLAQSGVPGLSRAVHSFDRSRGYKFSTYASWWIKHAIGRSIRDTGATIRLPSYLYENIQMMKRIKSGLEQNKGSQEISAEEIAKDMGVDPEKVSELSLLQQHHEPFSLDNILEKESSANYSKTFQEYLEDKDSVSAPDQISESQTHQTLYKALEALNPRDLDIIKSRFGFDNGEEETLEEVGNRYNLSRERVRQLQKQILRRLANNLGLQEIKDALK